MRNTYQSKLISKDKRISLVNAPTLLTLAVIILGLLWLLQPNKAVLIDMVDNSRSPEVAIAFLEVLQDNNKPSLQLRLALAKQHNRADQYQQSLLKLSPITDFADSKYKDAATRLYGENLLKLTQWLKHDNQYQSQLVQFLTSQVGVTGTEQAKERALVFANYALQISHPALALALLEPFRNTPQVSEQTLLSLALQAGKTRKAMQSAQRIYTQAPTSDNFSALLNLYQQLGQWRQGTQLVKQFFAKNTPSHSLYQQAIRFTRAAGQPALAFSLANALASNSSDPSTWLQASQIAGGIGKLPQAAFWLNKVANQQTSLAHLRQLHQYYRWLDKPTQALRITKRMSRLSSSPAILRAGLSEALAVSDLFALSDFYFLLAKQNQLSNDEMITWLDLNDKAYGAANTAKRLDILTKKFPKNMQIWHNLARFYEYQGNTKGIINIWPKVKPFAPYDQAITDRYARAFIKNNQLEYALKIYRDYTLRDSFDNEALATVEQLAWYINDADTVKQIQQARLKSNDTEIDPYMFSYMRKTMTNKDVSELLALYKLNKHPDSISAVINHAITTQNIPLLNTALELMYSLASKPLDKSLVLLTARADIVKQNWTQAISTLKALLIQHPDYQAAEAEAFWLALSQRKLDWLNHLYLTALPKVKNNPKYYQLLAHSAVALAYPQQAIHWFNLLQQENELNVSDKLTFASLLESQGMNASATQLRYTVFSQLDTELKKLPQGEISYRSLLSLFASPVLAETLAMLDAKKDITTAKLDELARFYFAQNALDKLQFYVTSALLTDTRISENLQFVLANAQNDHQTLHRLVKQGVGLSNFEKAIALEKLGHTKQAWQYAENALNQATSQTDITTIKRFLVVLHPQRTHALRATHQLFDSWHTSRSELGYYLPVNDNQWQLFARVDNASTKNRLLPDYRATQLAVQSNSHFSSSPWNVGLTATDRFGKAKLGGFVSWQYRAHRFQSTLKLAKNQQTTQSEALWLMGDEDRLELQSNVQITSRENISLTLHKSQFHSHFGDKIGSQTGVMLRANEKLFFEPRWEVYAQYDYQTATIDTKPLAKLNAALISNKLRRNNQPPLRGQDFLAPKFHRIGIGQRIAHGEVGQPGAIATAPRYWLDTAITYNLVEKRTALSANTGIGVPILGNDELFFTGTWQSADRNNQKNLTLTLGYYFEF